MSLWLFCPRRSGSASAAGARNRRSDFVSLVVEQAPEKTVQASLSANKSPAKSSDTDLKPPLSRRW